MDHYPSIRYVNNRNAGVKNTPREQETPWVMKPRAIKKAPGSTPWAMKTMVIRK
jgi:hypothetical protein